ncbi:hypothetical protein Tsp_10976 [Trichinella spiralis]|uniref:hypothetical protein n=1 Tax=Trichinella spiralis TaxID=6334 RepID=UPI0001EFBE21|nr:hypothetical protein Tsp_10976 [Trichinella spiralis]
MNIYKLNKAIIDKMNTTKRVTDKSSRQTKLYKASYFGFLSSKFLHQYMRLMLPLYLASVRAKKHILKKCNIIFVKLSQKIHYSQSKSEKG